MAEQPTPGINKLTSPQSEEQIPSIPASESYNMNGTNKSIVVTEPFGEIHRKRPSPEPSPSEEPTSKKSKESEDIDDSTQAVDEEESPEITRLQDKGKSKVEGDDAGSPSSIKSKEDIKTDPQFPSPPNEPATQVDKETWQGWCEIESDPAYFSVILREMGVQDVTVREVFGLDPSFLTTLPQPMHGLILLFTYREFGNDTQVTECPPNVWFANQMPGQNSCATLAMMNTLMNRPDIAIGEHLTQFKEYSQSLTPYQRGEAMASFRYVRKIHNSFAKKMDMMEGDTYLKYKVAKAAKAEALNGDSSKSHNRKRRGSEDSVDSLENYESRSKHFIAFVPIGNEVWKLDGLDRFPTSMGTFDTSKGETWLTPAVQAIKAVMASVANDNDYSVFAIAQAPLVEHRAKACLSFNTIEYIEKTLHGLAPDWKDFIVEDDEPPSPSMLGLETQLPAHPVPPELAEEMDNEEMEQLLERRTGLLDELCDLEASILAEMQQEAEENNKAMERRWDYGPAIQQWLAFLAENGYLEENLHRFMK